MAWYKAGGGSKPKQSKTVTPSTGVQEITADSGKELEKVTVQAMPSGALKTPTVNASGLVTSGVQTSGYIGTGTEKTLQLTTKSAQTYYPTTSDQTIPSGRYTTGVQTIKGDANLKAENIKSGVTMFGINGSAPKTTIDGVETSENMNLKSIDADIYFASSSQKSLSGGGSMIAFQDKLYALGGSVSNGLVALSLSDYGESWNEEPNIPNQIYMSGCVVFNGKIHTMGGSGSSIYTKHQTFDGTTWGTDVDVPYNMASRNACVVNNKIHVLGSNQSGGNYNHYSFDGSTWTKETNTPYSFSTTYNANHVCKYDNELHIFGSGGDYRTHYKYDSASKQWSTVDNAPQGSNGMNVIEHNGKVHLLGGNGTATYQIHYTYKDGVYTLERDLPVQFNAGVTAIWKDHIFIGSGQALYELNLNAYIEG